MKRSWPCTRELCENVPDIGDSPCEERKETNPNLSRAIICSKSLQDGIRPFPEPWEAQA